MFQHTLIFVKGQNCACAQFNNTTWRCMAEWMSSSMHPYRRLYMHVSGQLDTRPLCSQPKNCRYRTMAAWVAPRHCEDERSVLLTRRIEPQSLGRLVRAVDTIIDWADLSGTVYGYFGIERKTSVRGSRFGSPESKWTSLKQLKEKLSFVELLQNSYISPCPVYKLESLPTIPGLSCLFQLVFFFSSLLVVFCFMLNERVFV